MTESSLRDRVQANVADSLLDYLAHNDEWGALDLAEVATAAAFEAMAGARPCVTCGKGIGPAKVGKGYVQCYDCTRRRPVSIDHPVFSNPPAEGEFVRHRLGSWTTDR